MKGKGKVFIEHIEEHLNPDQQVICKICGKTVDEIYEYYVTLQRMKKEPKK